MEQNDFWIKSLQIQHLLFQEREERFQWLFHIFQYPVGYHRQWSFLLVVHTDKRGTKKYNQFLSEKRANTVRIELERQFPSLLGKLEAKGRGETDLLYDGDDETDHMLNRRVKVTLIP